MLNQSKFLVVFLGPGAEVCCCPFPTSSLKHSRPNFIKTSSLFRISNTNSAQMHSSFPLPDTQNLLFSLYLFFRIRKTVLYLEPIFSRRTTGYCLGTFKTVKYLFFFLLVINVSSLTSRCSYSSCFSFFLFFSFFRVSILFIILVTTVVQICDTFLY